MRGGVLLALRRSLAWTRSVGTQAYLTTLNSTSIIRNHMTAELGAQAEARAGTHARVQESSRPAAGRADRQPTPSIGRLLRRFASPFSRQLLLILGLSALTASLLVSDVVAIGYNAPAARLITETAIAMTGLTVAVISMDRYLQRGLALDAAIGVAFLMLTATNVAQGLILPAVGANTQSWGDAAIYVWFFSRFVSLIAILSAMILFEGKPTPRGERGYLFAAFAGLALLALAANAALTYSFHSEVPDLLTPTGRMDLTLGSLPQGAFLEVTTVNLAIQSLLTLLTALAAGLLVRQSARWQDGHADFHGWLSLALIIATFSQLHYIFFPTVYSSIISSGDVLRLAAYSLLLLAVFREYQQSRTEVTALRERSRIARDLHDTVAQSISFVLSSLRSSAAASRHAEQAETDVNQWIDVLGDAQAHLRDAVATLSKTTRHAGLPETVQVFCDGFSQRYAMEIRAVCAGRSASLAPPDDREVMMILAEALHNVRKHSGVSRAEVSFLGEQDHVSLQISDQGVGFVMPRQDGSRLAHRGLANMSQRASRLGGSLVITSSEKEGTAVRLTIPRRRLRD